MARGNGFDELIEIEKQNKKMLRVLDKIKPIDLRDQFAMAALTGIAPWAYSSGNGGGVAKEAYAVADAMLKAREES